MQTIAVLDLRIQPDKLERAREVLGAALVETRVFPGNLGAELLLDDAEPTHWQLRETWESIESDRAYRAWRAGEGAMTDFPPLLAGAPVMTRFSAAD